MITTAQQRSEMPSGAHQVLNRRSLRNGNHNLLDDLRPGMTVLDVGCGTGTITRGIAGAVGVTGKVFGIDKSAALIGLSGDTLPGNLHLQVGDLFSYEPSESFDLITASRVLQWLENPEGALDKMKSWLRPGGRLAILDYNHEKIGWTPEPPDLFKRFYRAFLAWREDAGMNNQIADDLANMLRQVGFRDIVQKEAFEESYRDNEFVETAGIWTKVMETRGQQMLRDGYLKEDERLKAMTAFDQWLESKASSMKLYLLYITGVKPN